MAEAGRKGGRAEGRKGLAATFGGFRLSALPPFRHAELFLDALREISAHKLRSLLTLSGIVFGAASLVSLASLATGLKTMAYADLKEIGFPRSYWLHDRAPRAGVSAAAALRHTGLRVADVEALRRLPGVEAAHGRVWGGERVVAGPRERITTRIDGVDAGFMELRHFRIFQGRSLRPLDVANTTRVAVVGDELADELFGAMNPVGQTLTIGGERYRVVGVMTPMPIGFIPANFSNMARRIYVPYSIFTRYEEGEGRVGSILVTARADADFARVLRDGRTLVRQRHHGVEDFEIENEAADVLSDLAMADGILGGWNYVMFAIAGVTLVVGGIGLFSVLLISVRERVREIGIRKALGADDGDILRLFLAESLTLAVLGAVLGVGGGAGLIVVLRAIGAHFGKQFVIPIDLVGVALAIVFAVAVGLLFGWYPARRAARLDPIQAIGGV
jgi:putative ABC transport system permease protein